MGKRKSKARVMTVKKAVLSKKFKCPFCCTEESCEVKFSKADALATISCRICAEAFETRVNSLSEPVDVYTSWIDACEAENAMEEGDDEFGPTEHSAAAAGTAAAAEVDDGDDL